jgi:hypothetical protein
MRSGSGSRLAVAAAVLLALAAAAKRASPAEEPTLQATLEASSYRIGDLVRIRLQGAFPLEAISMSPRLSERIGAFELVEVEAEEPLATATHRRQQWRITLRSFDPGTHTVPPLEVAYRLPADRELRIARGQPLTVAVLDVEIPEAAELEDIRAPVALPLTAAFLLGLSSLVLILLGVTVGWAYRAARRSKASTPSASGLEARQRALVALKELEAQEGRPRAAVVAFYCRLTDIVREFLRDGHGLPAPFLTTERILREVLGRRGRLGATHGELASLLEGADGVKFALAPADSVRQAGDLKRARSIVLALDEGRNRPPQKGSHAA